MTTTPAAGDQHPSLDILGSIESVLSKQPGTTNTQPMPRTEPPQPAPQPTNTTDQDANPRTMKAIAAAAAAGGALLAGIGFTGSYKAVRDLAYRKGFGWFANIFPIGVDAGILVLLALDLFLTHKRMSFPLLRYTAWALTGATIIFNAASGHGTIQSDPIAAGMHAVIPVLFIVATEAARHYVSLVADITAARHIESPPASRWLLAFPSTFRIWRKMRLWQLASYTTVIAIERDTASYRVQLRATYGRFWRRKAPVAKLTPLRLAKYGTPIAATIARQEAELANTKNRQIDRQDTASATAPVAIDTAKTSASERQNDRQDIASTPASGAGASASTTASDRQDHRQNERQEATPAASANRQDADSKSASAIAKSIATSGNKRQKPTTGGARKTAKNTASTASPRRSQDEWVALASPVFHRQFIDLRKVPTGRQFADAIASEGLGDVSESTAKNIRQWVLDAEPLPAI